MMIRNMFKRGSLLPLAAQFCAVILLLALLLPLAGCAASGGTTPLTPDTAPAALPTTSVPTSAVPATTEAAWTVEASAELPSTEVPATETPTEAPAAPDPADPLSYLGEALREEGDYTDDCGNEYHYSYAIPCILADTEGARAINAAIDGDFGENVREYMGYLDEGESLYCSCIEYRSIVWEDILTLVIRQYFPSDCVTFGVYSYEVSAGRWLTTPLLLEKMGVSETDFLEACHRRVYECYAKEHSAPGAAYNPEYDPLNMLDEQVSEEYVNLDLMTYPENGDLVIVAPILSVAGADFYYHILPLGLGGPLSLLGQASLEEGDYTDMGGNEYHYSYAIPCILADTDGARAINAAIDGSYGQIVQDAKAVMEDECSLIETAIRYTGHVWEEILTVELFDQNEWGCNGYGIYCYSTATGEWLTTAMILERMGISEEEFLDACRETFRQTFIDQYSGWSEEIRDREGYSAGLERATSDSYVNGNLQAYPDANGRLVVIAPIASLAGADFYYQVLPLDLWARN